MSDNRRRILAIIDPTRGDQWALRKAVSIAENRDDTEPHNVASKDHR
jgi:hypothetical protein